MLGLIPEFVLESNKKMTGKTIFLKNKIALLSLVFLVVLAFLALLAPWVTHYSFEEQNFAQTLQPPSSLHWMGTDSLGRDLMSRIIYGARISLTVGLFTTFSALILGTFVGSIAGYYGGWLDSLLMRVVDLVYIFPSTLLAILIMVMVGRGFLGILAALAVTSWVTQARLVRGLVLHLRELNYIEAARAMGITDTSILLRHIWPNILGPIIVSLTFQIPSNIMAESFLSFIGLGLQPPLSSWGTLASEGFRGIRSFPHLMIFPGTVLFVTMLAFNYLGEGLRDLWGD